MEAINYFFWCISVSYGFLLYPSNYLIQGFQIKQWKIYCNTIFVIRDCKAYHIKFKSISNWWRKNNETCNTWTLKRRSTFRNEYGLSNDAKEIEISFEKVFTRCVIFCVYLRVDLCLFYDSTHSNILCRSWCKSKLLQVWCSLRYI